MRTKGGIFPMITITTGSLTRSWPEPVSLQTIADAFAPDLHLKEDILLGTVNGRLCELSSKVEEDAEVTFLTYQDSAGRQTYQRSVLFCFLKAFYSVVGLKNHPSVRVEFTLGSGLFVRTHADIAITPDLIRQVQEKMESYVQRNTPIVKRRLHKDEAMSLFEKVNMYEKSRLFQFRISSWVSLYSLGNFYDYFYGYMTPSTGLLKYFRLDPWDDGILIQLPTVEEPTKVPALDPSKWLHLYETLKETEEWTARMNVPSIGDLNEIICQGELSRLILIQEALQEKKIASIASVIARDPRIKFILIAGPSSSGKTSFANRLSVQLTAQGMKPHLISADDYFVNQEDTPRLPDGSYDYESLQCVDLNLFNQDMTDLLAGKTIQLPTFNFIKKQREYHGETITLNKGDVLIVEGIHCLNPEMTASLPSESKYRIYISALTALNVDEHNYIPTSDIRLLRRIARDARTRGTDAQGTIAMWPSVRRGEERNIFPWQESAEVMFNSACVYELPMLKLAAEPLLFSIQPDSPHYAEARRLLRFLSYSLPASGYDVPHNSLLREFIGGSCFKV